MHSMAAKVTILTSRPSINFDRCDELRQYQLVNLDVVENQILKTDHGLHAETSSMTVLSGTLLQQMQ